MPARLKKKWMRATWREGGRAGGAQEPGLRGSHAPPRPGRKGRRPGLSEMATLCGGGHALPTPRCALQVGSPVRRCHVVTVSLTALRTPPSPEPASLAHASSTATLLMLIPQWAWPLSPRLWPGSCEEELQGYTWREHNSLHGLLEKSRSRCGGCIPEGFLEEGDQGPALGGSKWTEMEPGKRAGGSWGALRFISSCGQQPSEIQAF